MAQLFNIEDDRVVINKLALRYLEGPVTHAGQLSVIGPVSLGSTLTVNGEITADTIKVKTLITESSTAGEVGQWATVNDDDLSGKGFSWTHGSGSTQLSYRAGGRLWSNADIDLSASNSYKIDNLDVLSSTELGGTVTKSSLREVGSLKSLRVSGDTSLSDFAFFNSGFGRLGLNTDEPNAVLSIVDNDVEIVLGSPSFGVANIGTYTNHDVAIIADNTPRLIVKNNGEVVIGDPISKNSVLRVYGTIEVETIVADTRIDRYSSLEFKTTRDSNIYGKGLHWSGTGVTRYFVMEAGPDRIKSSESLDLKAGQCYYIDGKFVLNQNSLGQEIVYSNLSKLGVLESLTVSGSTSLTGNLEVNGGAILASTLFFNNGDQQVTLTHGKLNTTNNFAITVNDAEAVYVDNDEISLGNKSNTRRPVKVYGPLSVGITTPDPSVSLAVSGDVSFNDKKFTNGTSAPATGEFRVGDICWNQEPKANDYIGWVCVAEGTPGEWLPFGAINKQ